MKKSILLKEKKKKPINFKKIIKVTKTKKIVKAVKNLPAKIKQITKSLPLKKVQVKKKEIKPEVKKEIKREVKREISKPVVIFKKEEKNNPLPKIKITKRVKKEDNIFLAQPNIPTNELLLQTEQEIIEMIKFDAVKENIPKESEVLNKEEAKEEKYYLPFKYKNNRLVLLPRDPWWLYTYWDIADNKIDDIVKSIPIEDRDGLKWVLRVYDITGCENLENLGQANSYYDVDISYDASNWYLNVNQPGRSWCLEIGFMTRTNRFYPIIRSNITKTPNFGVSNELDEEWMLPDEEFFKLLRLHGLDAMRGKSSLSWQQLLEKQVSSQISSWITSPGAKISRDKFFLEVWTEVVLYGRTESDASVTIAGNPIKLKPDGTFAVRYSLPAGEFDFKVVGVSNNKKYSITKIPAVTRYEKEEAENKVKEQGTPQIRESF